jgi:secretion/DNA translocation related TadE-like protein
MTDAGSGTILGLGIIFTLLGIMTLGLTIEAENLGVARLQVLADTAVLAAEDRYLGLAVGFPCETADQIVKEFGATLEECHKVGSDIYIGVSQQLMGIVHRVNARAGSGMEPSH